MSKVDTGKPDLPAVTPRGTTPPAAPSKGTRRGAGRGPLARLGASGFSRIAGISASLVGTQAFTSVLGLIFWTLAARVFAPSEVGVAGAAIALMILLGSLGSLGLGTVLIARLPMTSANDRRVLVRTCLAAAFGGGVALGLIVPALAVTVFGVTALAPIAGSLLPLLGFALGTGLTSATIVLDQAVLTIGIGSLQLERNVTASAVKIIALIVLGITGQHGGMVIYLAWTIGTLASLPLVAWRTRGGRAFGRGRSLFEPRLLRGLGRVAVSHYALNVTIQAALQLLPVMVTILISATANASFNAAILFAGFVFALPYAVSIGLFAAARGDESEIVKRMRLTIPFGLAISVAADLVIIPLAGPLLHIFGSTYAAEGTVILQLIVLAGLPFVIKDHFIALRRVQGRTTQALAMTSVFLVLELAGAAIGARVGGVVGLCLGWIAVLVVEAIVLAIPLIGALRSARATPAAVDGTVVTGASVDSTAVLVEFDAPAEVDAPSTKGIGLDDNPVVASSAEVGRVNEVVTEPVGMAGGPANARSARKIRPRSRGSALSRWFGRNQTGPTLFIMALGVFLMAAVATAGRGGETGTLIQVGWVTGLIVIFAPAVVRIVSRATPTVERVVVAVALGMMLQFSRLVLNPTGFAFHDELIHADTLRQITETNHLFTANPLLPVSAYYPGLEVVTNAIERLTGLASFPSAAITLMLARVVIVLALICVIRLVTGSYRAGAVGVVIYLANPQLLFFNSQYSYQTLALPLAIASVYFFAARRRGSRLSLILPVATTVAVVFTHHLTGALLIAAFAVWLFIVAVRGRRVAKLATPGSHRVRRHTAGDLRGLVLMTLSGALALGVTIINPGNPILSYLGSIGSSSGTQLLDLAGGSKPKALFSDTAGTGPAPWEQALLIAAVLIAVASLLIVLGYLRTNIRAGKPLAVLLGLVAVLYPVIPGGHLTSATAEVGDRAAGFVFLGLAVVIGAWWWTRARSVRTQGIFVIGCIVLFIGNIVLGAGPTAGQLPGPYQISADARSVDAANLAAAEWENTNLPRDSVAYGDRTSGMLAASVGGQQTVLHVSTNIDASRLLLAPTVTVEDLSIIDQTKLSYLIVDERLSTGLPHQQFYIESGEYGNGQKAKVVSSAALHKFENIAGVDRLYDNGSLVIYNLEGLR
jgi:O-antigen/teichoic acid export membrane protein